ncbi:ankyrin-1-like [Trichogramma pretiosum]|uniref:ankyrin-1-like n=1 Tax=Trichogramma pretiosum TaxID=7493 RepID=UPI000C719C84|nr:ankyrin-1-like [Trichogramma pretiosum]
MAEDDQNCIKKLKIMRGEVNWEINNERRKFLNQFYTLIENWEGQLPNLPDIFQSEEIDWLLKQHVKIMCKSKVILKKSLLLDFVIRCGYKDQPKVNEDGRPLLRRTTPIHMVARHEYSLSLHYITRDLFKIYDRFDVNYNDEKSCYTHFHVACRYGCDEVVEKFLEFGQDPNCFPDQETNASSVDPPLRLALVNSHKQVVRLLLRFGADPNLTDAEGSTPLHLICDHCDDDFMEMFFKINEDMHRTLQVDALDNHGWAPLHLVLDRRLKKKTELLLSRGANPNLVNADGKSPLHMICTRDQEFDNYDSDGSDDSKDSKDSDDSKDSNDESESHDVEDYKLMEIFFKTCDEKHQTVDVDARDDFGRTPLHLVVRDKTEKLAELLLRRGANPNRTNSGGLTALHIMCKEGQGDDDIDNDYVDEEFVELFFKITDEMQQSVKVDAVDEKGNTPLYYALHSGAGKVVELLLRNGADPNLADAEGLTPLHILCQPDFNLYYNDQNLLEIFFEVNKDKHKKLQVDAMDKKGNAPLHLALQKSNKKVIELLLMNGANLNLPDAEGSTPLHIICKKTVRRSDVDNHRDLLKMFFEVSNVKNQPMQVDAFDKEGNAPLHLALNRNNADRIIVALLLSNGANPNLADANGSTPLHMMWKHYYNGYKLAKIFFDISDENDQTLQVDARDKLGRTPLHVALEYGDRVSTELLLRRGANPNLADAEGLTPLHVICKEYDEDEYSDDDSDDDGGNKGLAKLFLQINDEIQQTVQIDAIDRMGRTPLHYALSVGARSIVKLLLRRRADPNLADAEGLTPLHVICKEYDEDEYSDGDSDDDDNNLAKLFFQINDEIQQTVQIDAIDRMGRTPLHLALEYGDRVSTELLLRRGANPNFADSEGLTPLHINEEIQQTVQVNARDMLGKAPLHYALGVGARSVVKLLLRRRADPNLADAEGLTPLHINDEIQQTVQVNARDMLGNAPLHYALGVGDRSVVKLLLRRGADQNLANEAGATPLHIICQTKNANRLTKIFFKINDDIQETVQVDVRDKFGRTPLQWAVAKLKTHCFKSLLDRGADVSSFDFPTENYFAENYRPPRGVGSAVYNTMFILKSLEERGFNLDQNIALMIMKFFAKHGLITDESVDMDECLRSDEYFAREAKEHMMTPILSFYDFLRLPYEEAEKIFTLKNYEELTSEILDHYDKSHTKFILFLCEILTTRFFQRWTLEFFMTLTQYQLPILCCDIIIQQLRLKDLWCICLAAADQNLE